MILVASLLLSVQLLVELICGVINSDVQLGLEIGIQAHCGTNADKDWFTVVTAADSISRRKTEVVSSRRWMAKYADKRVQWQYRVCHACLGF